MESSCRIVEPLRATPVLSPHCWLLLAELKMTRKLPLCPALLPPRLEGCSRQPAGRFSSVTLISRPMAAPEDSTAARHSFRDEMAVL